MQNNVLNISLPRSKSNVIRYLIANYVFFSRILPITSNDPHDVQIVHRALTLIHAQKGELAQATSIDVEDCGAAYRFLLPILAATPGAWLLTGTERLLQRPIAPLIEVLKPEADIAWCEKGWQIKGREISLGDVTISCQQSTQWASALLLAQPLLHLQKLTILEGEEAPSYPYIILTQNIIEDVKNGKESYLHESDWSAAAYWYGRCLLEKNQPYHLPKLSTHTFQGDSVVAHFFAQWGITSHETVDGMTLTAHPQAIAPQTVHLAAHPDLAPVLATVAVLAPFELTLTGIENLQFKESNRLTVLIETLSQFTTILQHNTSSITITKRIKEIPKTLHFNAYHDHRWVMAWHLFSLFSHITIENKNVIKKSYPHFFHHGL